MDCRPDHVCITPGFAEPYCGCPPGTDEVDGKCVPCPRKISYDVACVLRFNWHVITKTSPCNEKPLTHHFYVAKLGFKEVYILAHLSKILIGELIGYSWSGVRPSSVRRTSSVVRRRPQCSKIFFSETALPIKARFYVEPPWVGGTIFCSRHLGHMTKMAATPIYGKNPSKRRADFYKT